MGWFGLTQDEPPPPPKGSLESLYSHDRVAFTTTVALAAGGGAGALFVLMAARSRLKRIPNAAALTQAQFARRNGWVKGKVTSVGDADGFRCALFELGECRELMNSQNLPYALSELASSRANRDQGHVSLLL